MGIEDNLIAKRDLAIYQEYLKGLEYRAITQAAKFELSISRYKTILSEQKKFHRRSELEKSSMQHPKSI